MSWAIMDLKAKKSGKISKPFNTGLGAKEENDVLVHMPMTVISTFIFFMRFVRLIFQNFLIVGRIVDDNLGAPPCRLNSNKVNRANFLFCGPFFHRCKKTQVTFPEGENHPSRWNQP